LAARGLSAGMNKFSDCGTEPLGIYPIVDSVEWLEKLLPLGVKTIQLRIKNGEKRNLENEIRNAVKLANQFHARLFINDYGELAISCQAYGVHLGQEDLARADIDKIRQAGLRLGISTHSNDEILRAEKLCPSYIAYGPIYSTVSKVMSFKPQGVLALKRVKDSVSYPLVAIGGINLERISEVLATGVDGIAMISAITHAEDPIAMTRKLLELLELKFHSFHNIS
jgi:thiamine-phosphate diphosphorylase